MASELKPCPFCGSNFKIGQEPHDNDPVGGMFYIFHEYGPMGSAARKCKLDIRCYFNTEKEAKDFWNTRPAPVGANLLASNPVDDKIAPYTDSNAPAAVSDSFAQYLESSCAEAVKRYSETPLSLRGPVVLPFDDERIKSPVPAATDTGLVTVAPTYITYNPVYHVTYEGADPKRGYVYVQAKTCPASVEALETVAWDTWGRGLRYSLRSQPEPGDEALVYRWRAEELLAAERAEKAKLEAAWLEAEGKISDLQSSNTCLIRHGEALKADNAAKDARIKELDRCHEGTIDLCNQKTAQIEALEVKLSAVEKALEPFADISDLIDAETEGMAETDELILHFHDYEFAKWPVSLFRKARAVLEGKPSC